MVDQLAPNVLTIAADGTVGALFPGGVQIPEGTSNFPIGASKAVEWIDGAGAAWESIQASLPGGSEAGGGNHQLALFAQRPTNPSDLAQLVLELANHTGFGFATSSVTAIAEDDVNLSAHQGLIIDSAGRSDFLRLGATGLSLSGSGVVTWAGGTAFSSLLTIPLPGATGTCFAVASIDNAHGFDQAVLQVLTQTGQVQINAATRAGGSPPAGTQGIVNYLVWGT